MSTTVAFYPVSPDDTALQHTHLPAGLHGRPAALQCVTNGQIAGWALIASAPGRDATEHAADLMDALDHGWSARSRCIRADQPMQMADRQGMLRARYIVGTAEQAAVVLLTPLQYDDLSDSTCDIRLWTQWRHEWLTEGLN